VVYSKLFNLGRKCRKFKKGKINVLEVKAVKYNNLKTNGKTPFAKMLFTI